MPLGTARRVSRTPKVGRSRRHPARTVILALGLLLAGCSFVSTRIQPYIGGPAVLPSDPAKIEILRAEPTRPHERLGEVFAEPSGDPTVAQYEQALREGGAKMGADAIVVVYDRMQVVGTMVTGPWWAPAASPIVGRVVVGLAIRYTGL
jgi:hypothetical protein